MIEFLGSECRAVEMAKKANTTETVKYTGACHQFDGQEPIFDLIKQIINEEKELVL